MTLHDISNPNPANFIKIRMTKKTKGDFWEILTLFTPPEVQHTITV